jgi:hypothetical protein
MRKFLYSIFLLSIISCANKGKNNPPKENNSKPSVNKQVIEPKPKNEVVQTPMVLFQPEELEVLGYNYIYNNQVLNSLSIKLKNSSTKEFSHIQVRVTVYTNLPYQEQELIYSKLGYLEGSISGYEINDFNFPDLKDLFTGVNLIDKNSFGVDVYVELATTTTEWVK